MNSTFVSTIVHQSQSLLQSLSQSQSQSLSQSLLQSRSESQPKTQSHQCARVVNIRINNKKRHRFEYNEDNYEPSSKRIKTVSKSNKNYNNVIETKNENNDNNENDEYNVLTIIIARLSLSNKHTNLQINKNNEDTKDNDNKEEFDKFSDRVHQINSPSILVSAWKEIANYNLNQTQLLNIYAIVCNETFMSTIRDYTLMPEMVNLDKYITFIGKDKNLVSNKLNTIINNDSSIFREHNLSDNDVKIISIYCDKTFDIDNNGAANTIENAINKSNIEFDDKLNIVIFDNNFDSVNEFMFNDFKNMHIDPIRINSFRIDSFEIGSFKPA